MNTRITPNHITELKPNEIFVFGSNLQGYLGGGAARQSMNHWGAVWGQGTCLLGQTFAIPTMQGGIGTIRPYIDQFIKFAQNDPERTFLVTEIGCGIAGFRPADIAPLFKNAINIPNIWLPQRFWEILQKEEVQDLI